MTPSAGLAARGDGCHAPRMTLGRRSVARSWRFRAGTWLLCALLGGGFGVASAATVPWLPLSERARRAEAIVLGRIETQHVEIDARGWPWTMARVGIERVVADRAGGLAAGGRLPVALLGGAVGDRVMRVPGEASLPVGARFVLLLWRDGRGRWRPLGMAQGALRVTRRADGADVVRVGPRAATVGGSGRVAPSTPAAGRATQSAPSWRSLQPLLEDLARWAGERRR